MKPTGLDSFVNIKINQMEQAVFQRMLGEFNEVNERAVKLRDFILGDKFKEVDNLNKDLLVAQLKQWKHIYQYYLFVLVLMLLKMKFQKPRL